MNSISSCQCAATNYEEASMTPRRWRRHVPSKHCKPLTNYAASRRL